MLFVTTAPSPFPPAFVYCFIIVFVIHKLFHLYFDSSSSCLGRLALFGLRRRSCDCGSLSWSFGLCHLLRAANTTLDTCCFSTGVIDHWRFCPIGLFNCWFYFCFAFGLVDFWQIWVTRNKTCLDETCRVCQPCLGQEFKTSENILQPHSSLLVISYIGSWNIKKHIMALKNHSEGHQTRFTNTHLERWS